MIFGFFVKYLVTFYFDSEITQVKPGAIFLKSKTKRIEAPNFRKKSKKWFPKFVRGHVTKM